MWYMNFLDETGPAIGGTIHWGRLAELVAIAAVIGMIALVATLYSARHARRRA